ncbi:MAG: hypothetical protein ACRC62_08095 [Microcoleus sp.]
MSNLPIQRNQAKNTVRSPAIPSSVNLNSNIPILVSIALDRPQNLPHIARASCGYHR